MLKIKVVTKCILYSTVISVCLLLSMKFLEIDKSYPRREFCMTCPSQPIPSFLRTVEEHIDFNLLLILDFLAMMMIILIFGSERYHRHPTYLFSFHVCRLIFNVTIISSTSVTEKVLKPIFEQLCGFGGRCLDEKIIPHTYVASLYTLFFVIMLLNFEICTILLYYNDPYRRPRTPLIVRIGDVEDSRYMRIRYSPPANSDREDRDSQWKKEDRSSWYTFTKIRTPFFKTQKYHRLNTCASATLRSSKHRVAPFTLPIPPELIDN